MTESLSRRSFLQRSAAGLAGSWPLTGVAAAAAGGGYGMLLEPRWVQWTAHEVPLPGLPRRLDGLRVAQVSDIHASSAVPLDFVRRTLQVLEADPPDLLVCTGDLLTADAAWAEGVARELARVPARLGHYAILGNHDYWTDGGRMSRALEAAGVHHLRNESVRIGGPGGLRLLGIDDHWTGNADLERAMAGVGPSEAKLLLMHSPDLVTEAAEADIRVALAGHTHGGQVRIPGWGALIVPSELGFQMGWYEHGPTRLYVNRGLGTLELKVRTLCRPEIALLTLRSA